LKRGRPAGGRSPATLGYQPGSPLKVRLWYAIKPPRS
jgi:hypothetical protein